MSWQQAHRYYRALRTVENELNWSADAQPAWRPEYAEIFGSPAGLMLALRSRWETMVHVQVEDAVDGWPCAELRALAVRHPGLVRALEGAGGIDAVDSRADALVAGAA